MVARIVSQSFHAAVAIAIGSTASSGWTTEEPNAQLWLPSITKVYCLTNDATGQPLQVPSQVSVVPGSSPASGELHSRNRRQETSPR